MITYYDMTSGDIVDEPGDRPATFPAEPRPAERLVALHEAIAPETTGKVGMPADLLQADSDDFLARQR